MPAIGYGLTYTNDAAGAHEALAATARQVYDDLEIVKTGAVWNGFKRDRVLDPLKQVKKFRERHVGLQVFSECRPRDVIIFPVFDRVFRSDKDFRACLRRWIEGNVRVILVDIGIDTGTEMGMKVAAAYLKMRKVMTRRVEGKRTRVVKTFGFGRPVLGLEVRGHRNSKALFVIKELYELGMKVKEWVAAGWSHSAIAKHLFENKIFRPISTRPNVGVAKVIRSSVAWEPKALKTLAANLAIIDEKVLEGVVRLPAGWKPQCGPLSELPAQAAGRTELPESRWKTAKAIGRKVKALRAERGVLQATLAAAAGMSQSQISDIETGQHVPLTTTLAAVARALGVTLAEFQQRADPLELETAS